MSSSRGPAYALRRSRSWLRGWQLWGLAPSVRGYLVGICAVWIGAVVFCATRTSPSTAQVLTFLLLIACGSVAVEATRRQGEPAGVLAQDLLSAWWLPIAFVLPPAYSLLAPIPLMALTQLRVRQTVLHRRVFTAAVLGLSNVVASLVFHSAESVWTAQGLMSGVDALLWAATALACAVIALVLNGALLAPPIKATQPEVTWSDLLLGKDNLVLDWGEMCTGVLLAVVCALHPALALVALTPVILLQRGLMHDQLSAAVRLDPKTSLLNAPTWEREATSEIARALRTKSSLSVMLLDLDHFKQVNDRFGHLAGDNVLRAVADVLRAQTREYDLCARFGGDEFAVLLPQSDLQEAARTAERIRTHVAALTIPAGTAVIGTSVSIGIADLTSPQQGVTDLLAAADISLYREKANRPPAMDWMYRHHS